MSINLGLDGLRKAVIRADLYINALPEKSRALGAAMVQQRIALKAATLSSEVSQCQRRQGLALSKERMQQIKREQASPGVRRQALTTAISHVGQRYQAGQAVVEKVSSVSGRAMALASSGAKLLKPGYAQANASSAQANTPPGGTLTPGADSLAGDIGQLNAVIGGITLSVLTQLDGMLRLLTHTATGLLTQVERWIQDNPLLAGGITQLVTGGALLVAALGGMGTVVAPVLSGLNLLMAGAGILSSVFTFTGGAIAAALGAITLPIGIVVAAVAVAAALIYKYWQPISAFFSGVAKGIGEGMAPVEPLFNRIVELVSWMRDKFLQLTEPVSLMGETLSTLGGAGERVGKMLVSAFTLPITLLNSLMGGIDWMLEKLDVIKSSPAVASRLQLDVPQPTATMPGGAANPALDPGAPVTQFGEVDTRLSVAAALPAGGRPYQPLVPVSNSNSQQNTFNSNYVINTHPGMSQAEVLAIVESHRQQALFTAGVKQRSSVWG